jgi:hypothetical protein
MSTQIRYRLSGEEEQAFLDAAQQSGLQPDAYARARALASVNPADGVLQRIEQRLDAIEAQLAAPQAAPAQPAGLASTIKGIGIEDLVIEIRREMRSGLSAFLVLLDGEPLPDIPNSRAQPDSDR